MPQIVPIFQIIGRGGQQLLKMCASGVSLSLFQQLQSNFQRAVGAFLSAQTRSVGRLIVGGKQRCIIGAAGAIKNEPQAQQHNQRCRSRPAYLPKGDYLAAFGGCTGGFLFLRPHLHLLAQAFANLPLNGLIAIEIEIVSGFQFGVGCQFRFEGVAFGLGERSLLVGVYFFYVSFQIHNASFLVVGEVCDQRNISPHFGLFFTCSSSDTWQRYFAFRAISALEKPNCSAISSIE